MTEEGNIVIDLTGVKDRDELYAEVYSKLGYEDSGRNLDALWDVLTGMELHFGTAYILRNTDYGDEIFTEYVGKVCRVFTMAQEEFDEFRAIVFRPEE